MNLVECNILLGVTGGIAAYKAVELCRLLKKAGANVRVVMTQGACEFVQPLSFQAVSGSPVSTKLLDEEAEAGMGHIELAKWADTIVIAPATANTIARLSAGFADDLLSTLVLASEANLLLAPAMNQVMWSNPATQQNLQRLGELYADRLIIAGPASGEQACGDVGYGRMLEPSEILSLLQDSGVHRDSESRLASGLRVVITAGPTREAIDPVRYISNHSSGKMGFALAECFRTQGADVCLIAGPVALSAHSEIERVDVVSAQEMYSAALQQKQRGFDVFIGTAAVADYAPADVASIKLKKNKHDLVIELQENPDIIASVADGDNTSRMIVGFAAETNDVVSYAQAKLKKKGLDLVIANDVSDSSIGFNSDHNCVTLVHDEGSETLPRATKMELSRVLVERICAQLNIKRQSA